MRFEEARRLAQAAAEPDWPELGAGTPYALPNGYEDADCFAVTVVAREWAVDKDHNWISLDPPLFLVDKDTGYVVKTTYLMVSDRVDKMREVSVG